MTIVRRNYGKGHGYMTIFRRIRAWFRRELSLAALLGTCDRGPNRTFE